MALEGIQMNTAYTNLRVETIKSDAGPACFEVMATRDEKPVYLAIVSATKGSPYHIQTETEARYWAQLFAGAEGLLRVCQEFVRRVEAGEIRSTGTYAAMLTAIKQATKPE